MTYPKEDSSPDVESDSNVSYRSSEENSGDSDIVEDFDGIYEHKHNQNERLVEETNYGGNIKDKTTEEDFFQASLPRSFPDEEPYQLLLLRGNRW